jgi:transcriptional regulator with XRE-family HTH domain
MSSVNVSLTKIVKYYFNMTKPNNSLSLGKQFRQLREQKGLLIRQVAAVTDMDQAIISKIENSDRVPTREQVTKLAALYDLEIQEVLTIWLSEKLVKEYGSESFAPAAMQSAGSAILCSLSSISEKDEPEDPTKEKLNLF